MRPPSRFPERPAEYVLFLRYLGQSDAELEAKIETERKANLDKEKALSDRQRDLNNLIGKIRGLENDRQCLELLTSFGLNFAWRESASSPAQTTDVFLAMLLLQTPASPLHPAVVTSSV